MSTLMAPGVFKPDDWVETLAQVLSGLDAIQDRYRDELYRRQQYSVRPKAEMLSPIAPHHPSADLLAFYSRACSAKAEYVAGHYSPLRSALAEVHSVLAAHPAWAQFLDPTDHSAEFWTQIANSGSLGSTLGIIGGLMARARKVRENGFRVASSELNALLNGDGDLAKGYHVALFHGLHVREEAQIAEDLAIVPFEQMGGFVNAGALQEVAPSLVKDNRWESVGAIVKPFRWKPEFRERGDRFHSMLDWPGPFFRDAEALIELLAMFHAAAVICLLRIPYCIDRTAAHLLGQTHHHSSYGWGPSTLGPGVRRLPSEVKPAALAEATNAFECRNSDRFKDCAPVIVRLAEALARSGRFEVDDKILDVAIALERMYKLEGNELVFKLKARAACFLESRRERRLKVFKDIGDFYKMRSAIVHTRKKPPSAEVKYRAFTKGFEIARRSVVKLLHAGPPSNWNEVVLGGTQHPTGTSRRCAEEFKSSHRNRNS